MYIRIFIFSLLILSNLLNTFLDLLKNKIVLCYIQRDETRRRIWKEIAWEETQSTRQLLSLTWANIFSGRGDFLYTTSPLPLQSKSVQFIKRDLHYINYVNSNHKRVPAAEKRCSLTIQIFFYLLFSTTSTLLTL